MKTSDTIRGNDRISCIAVCMVAVLIIPALVHVLLTMRAPVNAPLSHTEAYTVACGDWMLFADHYCSGLSSRVGYQLSMEIAMEVSAVLWSV